jgi:hypothetical protein
MERAPLRPVPSRPPGPIVPAEAVGYVTDELPGLDGAAAAAFALVGLVGRPRPEVGGSPDAAEAAGLSGEALADALARARKALRRKLYPLPGSGWCERAERLISDRLDGSLEDPGSARLEVHLANCGRCVEHERRLGQASEALLAGFVKAHPGDEPAPELPAPVPEAAPVLRAVEAPALPAPSSGTRPPLPPGPAALAPLAAPAAPATRPPPHRFEPAPAAPTALETGSRWTSIGPRVALVSAAVAIVLAGVLARSGHRRRRFRR